MAAKKQSIKAGKVVAKRAFAWKWLREIDGLWTFIMLRNLGHTLKNVTTHDPTSLVVEARENLSYKIGTKTIKCVKLFRAGPQLSSLKTFKIDAPADFDMIFPVFSKEQPKVVNSSKGIVISEMVTEKGGVEYRWQRKNVAKANSKNKYRLLLMSIDNVDTKTMAPTKQRRLAGKIVEDICKLRGHTSNSETCELSF